MVIVLILFLTVFWVYISAPFSKMAPISKILLVGIVYAIYLLHNSEGNILLRNMGDLHSDSNLNDFVRHIRTMETAGEEKQQLCGNRFPEMVRLVCKSNFFSMHKKRSPPIHGFERFRREITLRKECCEIGCRPKTLLRLCNLEPQTSTTTTPVPLTNATKIVVPFKILRALLEFFAKTRQLSPNGYQSNFPTQTVSSPEASSPENTVDERNIIPEVAAQTENRPSQYQRGRLPIPKANIIRDEDDEGSVFSVGL